MPKDQDFAGTRVFDLLYMVMFSKNPLDEVDRVLEYLRKTDETFSPAQYSEIISNALGSRVELSKMFSQPHSEEAVRAYLKQVQLRLERQI